VPSALTALLCLSSFFTLDYALKVHKSVEAIFAANGRSHQCIGFGINSLVSSGSVAAKRSFLYYQLLKSLIFLLSNTEVDTDFRGEHDEFHYLSG